MLLIDKLKAKSHAIFQEGIDSMLSNHQCNDGDATVTLLKSDSLSIGVMCSSNVKNYL